jgi:hypothetical protein
MATKHAAASKSSTGKTHASKSATPPSKRWSAKVKTDSTKPAPGLFNKSAKAIADNLASQGPGAGYANAQLL